MREGVPDSDCNINVTKFSTFINVELANTLGNLYQRCLPFNRDLVYPTYAQIEAQLSADEHIILANLDSLRLECNEHYEAFNFYKAIQAIMARLRTSNNLVQEYKPWDLVKSQSGDTAVKLRKMLFLVLESLRVSGILLQPIVPNVSAILLDKFNVEKEARFYDSALVDYKRQEVGKIAVNSDVIFKRI